MNFYASATVGCAAAVAACAAIPAVASAAVELAKAGLAVTDSAVRADDNNNMRFMVSDPPWKLCSYGFRCDDRSESGQAVLSKELYHRIAHRAFGHTRHVSPGNWSIGCIWQSFD